MRKYLGIVDLAGATEAGTLDLQSMFLAVASGMELYRSDIDFAVARNDATSLDLSGLSFDPVANLFVLIEDFNSSGVFIRSYSLQTNVFSWDSANQRITVTGAAFSAGGSWRVSLWGPPRTVSLPENAQMVLRQNQERYGSDDAGVALISAAQAFTDAWVNLGAEIPMHGWRSCVFYLTLDVNDDSDLRFRVLAKHESGGAEEYTFPILSPGSGVVAVQDEYFEFTDDADQLITIPVETLGAAPYLQAQIQRGVNGAGTAAQIDAAAYVRGV